jgi:hypothetical protein
MMWRPARSATNIREPECRLSSPNLYIKDHHPNKIKDQDQVTTFRFNLHPIIRFTPSREFGIFTVSSMLLLLFTGLLHLQDGLNTFIGTTNRLLDTSTLFRSTLLGFIIIEAIFLVSNFQHATLASQSGAIIASSSFGKMPSFSFKAS